MENYPTNEDCEKTGKLAVALAAKAFPKVRIVRAEVKVKWDIDGDPFLWVRIIVDKPKGERLNLDADYQLKLQLSREMEAVGITAYPLITYPSYAELGDAA